MESVNVLLIVLILAVAFALVTSLLRYIELKRKYRLIEKKLDIVKGVQENMLNRILDLANDKDKEFIKSSICSIMEDAKKYYKVK
jgi:hypothetical protein